jgi:Pyruvate/2-oxoglutarate dehydrogenase complex, dehydrogenase (E1) component, eukaryotic type, beta subunit
MRVIQGRPSQQTLQRWRHLGPFEDLQAPVKLVTPPATPVPFSEALEREWIPSTEKIIKAIREVYNYKRPR